MQVYINANNPEPVQGQDGRLKVGPMGSLATPPICFKLARAVEWMHHHI